MISETLKKYLPSKSYLEYLERIDHSFTDFEEASILCQLVDDVFLLHEELDKILLRTEDKTLKEQIEDYLSFERRKIEHFCDNRNRTHVYILEESVTTYEAVDYLDCEGTLCFNPDGVLEHYYSGWGTGFSEQEIAARAYASDQFYHAYVDLPFPFEKGDFVRFVTNSKRDSSLRDDVLVGIVDVSPEEWDVWRQRAKMLYKDDSDASVTVQFLYRSGDFGHEHISPFNLEKVDINSDEPWYELAYLGQGLVMGDADIGFFTHFQQNYKDYLAWKKESALREILKEE